MLNNNINNVTKYALSSLVPLYLVLSGRLTELYVGQIFKTLLQNL
jgi:hypothetical protein